LKVDTDNAHNAMQYNCL